MAFSQPRQFFDVARHAQISRSQIFAEPPRPPGKNRRPWIFAGFAVFGLPVVVGLGVLFARAGYAYFYPGECSGNWQFAERAAGRPELDRGADAGAFTPENSAIGTPGAEQMIVCGHFDGENLPGKILRVRVRPSWVLKNMASAAPQSIENDTALVEPATTTEETASEDSLNSTAAIPEDAGPTPSSSEVLPPTDASGEPQVPPAPSPEDPTPTTPTESESLPPPSAEPSAPSTPEVPPAAPAAETPASPPSSPPESPTAFFVPRAYAQEAVSGDVPKVSAALVVNGYENFIAVEYSNDDVLWSAVDNANLEIPVRSWEDLRNIRVRVRLLRGGADLPSVYLDGIELETRYLADGETDESLATEENVQLAAVGESASAAIEQLTEAVSDLPQAIEDAVQAVVGNEPSITAVTAPAPSAEPRVPEPAFRFASLTSDETLRDAVFRRSASDPRPAVTAALADEGRALQLSGGCTKKYVALIVFPREEDPLADPTRAVVNRAETCAGGAFVLELREREFSEALPEGEYAVFVAEQNELGSWYPGTLAAWNMAARRILE